LGGFEVNLGRSWTDQRIEGIIANLLRAGVLLSAVVVSCGGIIYLVRHGHSPADYRVFHGEPTDLRTLQGICGDALRLSARGIIQLGLLILIATPVARVAFSVWAFAAEHDRMYVVFTLIVLAILVCSLAGFGGPG
jgi:uncharacterized membrane protein